MNRSLKKRARPYRSTLRAEQAGITRQRVLDAATTLFIDRGFAGTTVAATADAADVSPETIYATFGGKKGLLDAVIEAAINGPEVAIPFEEQSHWETIRQRPTARARLRAYVQFCCTVLARTSAMHRVIRGAADSEPFAVELRARLLAERLARNTKYLREFVGDDLPSGVSLRRAAERFCALTSPELHQLLTVDLGWSLRAHQDWLTAVAEQDLLGSE